LFPLKSFTALRRGASSDSFQTPVPTWLRVAVAWQHSSPEPFHLSYRHRYHRWLSSRVARIMTQFALGRTVDLDEFPRALERGITSNHPDMPAIKFSQEQARAVRAYLRAIQQ
jgi:hypothetical protein